MYLEDHRTKRQHIIIIADTIERRISKSVTSVLAGQAPDIGVDVEVGVGVIYSLIGMPLLP